MSDQSNQQEQPAPQALRQSMLDQLETSKKAIEELSDEEVEAVAGGYMVAASTLQLTPQNKTPRLGEPVPKLGIGPMIAAPKGSAQHRTVGMIDKTELMK